MKVAYLFPGQGSQHVGMLGELYHSSPAANTVFQSASAILKYDIGALCLNGPEETLKQTLYAQPALYTSSCAALAALTESSKIAPFAAAGHSVGEYAALFSAGAMDFATGLRLVMRRAELMHASAQANPGAMAAVIGLDSDAADQACAAGRHLGVVVLANYNCPGQVVLSGSPGAVDAACATAKELGARVVPLAVSGAFHSPLMVSAGDLLHPALREAGMRQTRFPIIVNIEAAYCSSGVDFAPFLTMQVSGPVLWEQSMRLLIADGVDTFIEVGAGTVLAGLMKRIDRTATMLSVRDNSSLQHSLECLAAAEGQTENI